MGAVFRIEKTKDFNVMSNHHLRNTSLSLKAKGLLSLILSLPDNWDYTVKGQLTTVEYIISEQPKLGLPKQEKPKRENPEQANPRQENPDQLNTNISNTESVKDAPDGDNSENQSGWIVLQR